jgi:pyruvate formate lyase activating enzyme
LRRKRRKMTLSHKTPNLLVWNRSRRRHGTDWEPPKPRRAQKRMRRIRPKRYPEHSDRADFQKENGFFGELFTGAPQHPMTATILNIQRFSTHDGPGIRTTVFFKGCTNSCAWCHNPESLRGKPEIQVYPELCIGCGRCLSACSVGAHEDLAGRKVFHRERCTGCGRCAEECFAQALVLAGKETTVDELVAEILKDESYYRQSGGGVTFSGGEPVLAGDFLLETLRRCKSEGTHTTLQTAGNYPWRMLEPLLPLLDLVMFDVKAGSPETHRRYVGTELEGILSNLRELSGVGIPVLVRTPVVGGVNDSTDEIVRIAQLIQGLPNVIGYELLPYHPLGNSKRESLGLPDDSPFEVPTPERMRELAAAATVYTPTVAR